MPDTSARPPFRADHVGSLLRPKEVLQARDDFAAGTISAAAAQGDRGRSDPEDHPDAGRGWPQDRDRRRAAPPVVAHGLHLPARRHQEGRTTTPSRSRSTTRTRTSSSPRRRRTSTAPVSLPADDLRRRLHLPAGQRGGRPDPEDHHPQPPAWSTTAAAATRSTTAVYPDLAQFWDDLAARLRPGDPAAVRPRLPLPAAGRHQPGLRQRPGAARAHQGHRRRPAAPARDLHRHDQQGAGRPPGRPDRHHAHVPRQQPVHVGGRGRLRLRRRLAVQRASTWTASSASGTTSAPAASSRCATCPRASASCSASSPARAASLSPRTSSSAASTRPPSTPTSTSSACPPSAASPPPGGQRPHRAAAVGQARACIVETARRSGAS